MTNTFFAKTHTSPNWPARTLRVAVFSRVNPAGPQDNDDTFMTILLGGVEG